MIMGSHTNPRFYLCGLMGLFVILVKQQNTVVGHIMGNILTNEVMEVPKDEEFEELPICRTGSACGYLQVNAFGVTQQQLCRCRSLTSVCPLHWDPEDGHSVTMGSQQYKFCGPSPRLPMCKRSEPAYTHAIFFDQSTYDILGIMANLHCLCLPPRTHVFHESTDDVIENMHVLGTVHTCSLLPFCDFESPCKEISLARSASIVTTNCQCRKGFVCPTLSTEASPNNMNENFANGKVFSILCQPWY